MSPSGAATGTVAEAYAHCERITTSAARNFAYGIRLLPPPKRAALSAVYAFSRRIDDIGDGDDIGTDTDLSTDASGPIRPPDAAPDVAGQLARLAAARADLERIGPDAGDPVLVALDDAARRLPIPLAVFGELIDGVEADVRGVRYDTADELVHYCRCVAGSIGRLSLGVFGGPSTQVAVDRADALGVALQLTNILRDVREDLRGGRVYLPADDLDRFGATLGLTADGEVAGPRLPLMEAMRFVAGRARGWYGEGLALVPMLDARSAACCAAMAGIYRRLLDRIDARPDLALQSRQSLPGREKVAVAAVSLGRAVWPTRARTGR